VAVEEVVAAEEVVEAVEVVEVEEGVVEEGVAGEADQIETDFICILYYIRKFTASSDTFCWNLIFGKSQNFENMLVLHNLSL
jgi:hypothetical protein